MSRERHWEKADYLEMIYLQLSLSMKIYLDCDVKTVQVGNDQEKAQSESNSHSESKPSEELFPNRRPLRYPNLNKNMKTYIRFKQHKTKQMEPQQKHRL